MSETARAIHVPPGVGQSYWVARDYLTVKLSGRETGGAFSVIETLAGPQVGPPPHVHSREDETFYVLEGTFEFLAGDRTLTATAGAVVYGPRGVPHTFKNVGDTPGRLLVVAMPAGFEEFVAEVGTPAEDPATPPPPPDPAYFERLVRIAGKHGIALVGS